MDFYLNDPDPAGPQLHFPVNPEEVQIRRDRKYETLNIVGLGEIDFSHGEKVREVTFSSFFPAKPTTEAERAQSYFRYPLPEDWDPQTAMNRLTSWMNQARPVRLIISETAVNVLVLVSAHNSTFRGGEPGDVYFELSCRTWREAKVRLEPSSGQARSAPSAPPRTDTKPVPKVYTVRPGDSLYAIAKRELGDSSRWRAIYEKNIAVVGNNPNLILAGQKLVMP